MFGPSDFDELGEDLQATAEAITKLLLLIPGGTVKLGTTPERQEIPGAMELGQKKLNEFRDEVKLDEYFAESKPYKTRASILEKDKLKLKRFDFGFRVARALKGKP
jgi:hypothetical protein